MAWLDFSQYAAGFNALAFLACAALVWIAGSRLAVNADRLASASGLGQALVGMVVLAALSSLPETAVTLDAAVADTPHLAINNLLGSIAVQITLLAVGDAIVGRDALTVVAGHRTVLLQATFVVLMLLVLALGLLAGDVALLGAGAWTWGLLLLYFVSVRTIARERGRAAWQAQPTEAQRSRGEEDPLAAQAPPPPAGEPVRPLLLKLAVAGAVILAAGFLLARSGEAIAQQTGLGASFVGVALTGVAGSLPEISTVVTSMRRRRYQLALAGIFGGSLFNVMLVFVADLLYGGGPALREVGRFALAASLLGAVLSAIYLVGLLERRDRTIARMGIDSVTVLFCYAAGLVLLYRLREP